MSRDPSRTESPPRQPPASAGAQRDSAAPARVKTAPTQTAPASAAPTSAAPTQTASVGERLREARLQRGWSQDMLAREAGTSQTTIDKIERNLTQRSRALPRLAHLLGVDLLALDPDYLDGGLTGGSLGKEAPASRNTSPARNHAGPQTGNQAEAGQSRGAGSLPPLSAAFARASAARHPAARNQAWMPEQPVPPPVTGTSPRSVPVFGTAQGGTLGATGLPDSAQALDWARLPSPLAGIPGLFALYVEGDSMEPWVEHGHLIYVHPTRPAAPRDHVVVVVQDGEYEEPRTLVKRLVRRTAGRLVLHQYNPSGEIEIDARTVVRIYRVIPWNEVAGV